MTKHAKHLWFHEHIPVHSDLAVIGNEFVTLYVHSCIGSSLSLMEDEEENAEKRRGLVVQLDPKEKMSYTEQAAKRQHCQRLTR